MRERKKKINVVLIIKKTADKDIQCFYTYRNSGPEGKTNMLAAT